jgi:hypothetical protein
VHPLVRRIQARLACSGEKEQSDEKTDQQQGGQNNVPPADVAQFLAQDFHVKMPALCR